MNKKILVGSIIAVAILILASTASAVDVKTYEDDGEMLAWQSYAFCTVYGNFYEMFPRAWIGPFPLVKMGDLSYATLNGNKGPVEVKEFIGFGFIGMIYPFIEPRTLGTIDGFFLFCLYKI